MHRILATSAAAGAIVTLLSGCYLSDPILPPMALRMDGGVLSAMIPICSGEEVVGGELGPFVGDGSFEPTWTAEGFKGNPGMSIKMSKENWHNTAGKYDGLSRVEVSIETNKALYGEVVDDVARLEDLPEGRYLMESRTVTPEEYQAFIEEEHPCDSRGK